MATACQGFDYFWWDFRRTYHPDLALLDHDWGWLLQLMSLGVRSRPYGPTNDAQCAEITSARPRAPSTPWSRCSWSNHACQRRSPLSQLSIRKDIRGVVRGPACFPGEASLWMIAAPKQQFDASDGASSLRQMLGPKVPTRTNSRLAWSEPPCRILETFFSR
jgi:hypothetical protein